MSYKEVANSKILFIMCTATIAVVVVQSVLFIRKAFAQGDAVGIEKNVMKKAMVNSAVFSIVPSLPIILTMLALSVPLGKYFPWLRLSVVGSATYEGTAAELAMIQAGIEEGLQATDKITPEIYMAIMWVMSIGIIWGIVFNIFFMRKLDKASQKAKSSSSTFIPILSSALFMGMLSVMSAPHIANVKNITAIFTYIGSAIMAIFLTWLSKKIDVKWIGEFSMPFGMIFGMFIAIMCKNVLYI